MSAKKIKITPAMIEAGIEAAELEGYEWGWGQEETLVTRVYEAMRTAALSRSKPTPRASKRGKHSSP